MKLFQLRNRKSHSFRQEVQDRQEKDNVSSLIAVAGILAVVVLHVLSTPIPV